MLSLKLLPSRQVLLTRLDVVYVEVPAPSDLRCGAAAFLVVTVSQQGARFAERRQLGRADKPLGGRPEISEG